MLELAGYGIGFFVFTLLLQYLLYKIRKNHNQGADSLWVGNKAVLVLCVVGIMDHNINYLAAVLGFVCADEAGKAMGWH